MTKFKRWFYGSITKSMLDELIERYVSHYGVEVEDELSEL